MACSCNNSYYNLPCCCPTEPLITTTTTLCPDGTICEEVLQSDCIIYNGYDLGCYGIAPGSSLTTILQTLILLLPGCSTTTTEPPVSTTTIFSSQPICLRYSTTSCATACISECTNYYLSSSCYTAFVTHNAFNMLNCYIYLDAGLTQPAPLGFYSYDQMCIILGHVPGEITGVTNCP
jgi:hypothetical protein